MSQILVPESFLKGSMFVLNFTKIERGLDFFLLIWYGMTLLHTIIHTYTYNVVIV